MAIRAVAMAIRRQQQRSALANMRGLCSFTYNTPIEPTTPHIPPPPPATTEPSSRSFLFNPPPNPNAVDVPKAEPSTNLFVSGLSKRTTTEALREAFAKFGEVLNARVVTDRSSGYSKGFGFVRYATIEDAAKGIEGMDGKFLDGWVIFAEYARPRPQQPPPERQYGNGTPYQRY